MVRFFSLKEHFRHERKEIVIYFFFFHFYLYFSLSLSMPYFSFWISSFIYGPISFIRRAFSPRRIGDCDLLPENGLKSLLAPESSIWKFDVFLKDRFFGFGGELGRFWGQGRLDLWSPHWFCRGGYGLKSILGPENSIWKFYVFLERRFFGLGGELVRFRG